MGMIGRASCASGEWLCPGHWALQGGPAGRGREGGLRRRIINWLPLKMELRVWEGVLPVFCSLQFQTAVLTFLWSPPGFRKHMFQKGWGVGGRRRRQGQQSLAGQRMGRGFPSLPIAHLHLSTGPHPTPAPLHLELSSDSRHTPKTTKWGLV